MSPQEEAAAIQVLTIYKPRLRFTEEGERKTWCYSLPPVSSFTEAEIQRHIAYVRRTHPDWLMLRPDQWKIRQRAREAQAA